uniref:Uncharacterized protein n=1 Tax=Oryza brachyantha TaxID=4533 RepID=J3KU17_ORYBR
MACCIFFTNGSTVKLLRIMMSYFSNHPITCACGKHLSLVPLFIACVTLQMFCSLMVIEAYANFQENLMSLEAISSNSAHRNYDMERRVDALHSDLQKVACFVIRAAQTMRDKLVIFHWQGMWMLGMALKVAEGNGTLILACHLLDKMRNNGIERKNLLEIMQPTTHLELMYTCLKTFFFLMSRVFNFPQVTVVFCKSLRLTNDSMKFASGRITNLISTATESLRFKIMKQVVDIVLIAFLVVELVLAETPPFVFAGFLDIFTELAISLETSHETPPFVFAGFLDIFTELAISLETSPG